VRSAAKPLDEGSLSALTARSKQLSQLIWRNGRAEKVSLSFITIMCPQKLQILGGFDSLGHDPQVKSPTYVDESSLEKALWLAWNDYDNRMMPVVSPVTVGRGGCNCKYQEQSGERQNHEFFHFAPANPR
jgi:hypothetical protein